MYQSETIAEFMNRDHQSTKGKTDAASIAVGSKGGTGVQGDFLEQAKEISRWEGITLIAAMQRLEKTNPQLRADYVAAGVAKVEAARPAARLAAIAKAAKKDFLSEARLLARNEKITMTEADRKSVV
jgi:hypothetical protein